MSLPLGKLSMGGALREETFPTDGGGGMGFILIWGDFSGMDGLLIWREVFFFTQYLKRKTQFNKWRTARNYPNYAFYLARFSHSL